MELRGDSLTHGRAVATVRRNGKDTDLACKVVLPEVDCSEEITVEFAAGDLLSVSYSETEAPNARVMVLLEFVSSTSPTP
jgi:hypothetical protein